jgi:ABC-2 type transport system permease protein
MAERTRQGIGDRAAGFLVQSFAIADAEGRKLRRDPSELLTRAVQPALWLVLFGQVMAQVHGLGPAGRSYVDFLAPGILAQSVLFAAIFYGIAAIWERDLGVLHRYMVSPAPRLAIVAGKAASAGLRGLVQAAIVYALSFAIGVKLSFAPLDVAIAAAVIVLGSALFSTLSLIVACWVKTRDRFMGVGQVLTMPIFFASNAIYPIDAMPAWLRTVSKANPLTYQVDALRHVMLQDWPSEYGLWVDFGVLAAATYLLALFAARLYPRLTA